MSRKRQMGIMKSRRDMFRRWRENFCLRYSFMKELTDSILLRVVEGVYNSWWYKESVRIARGTLFPNSYPGFTYKQNEFAGVWYYSFWII